jgi:hypothetical protein
MALNINARLRSKLVAIFSMELHTLTFPDPVALGPARMWLPILRRQITITTALRPSLLIPPMSLSTRQAWQSTLVIGGPTECDFILHEYRCRGSHITPLWRCPRAPWPSISAICAKSDFACAEFKLLPMLPGPQHAQ